MNICIFLPTGKTFTFHDVEITHSNETVLAFAYTAMSDGNQKLATFLKASMAGWSVWDYPEDDAPFAGIPPVA